MAYVRGVPEWLVELPVAHRGLHDLAKGCPENSLAAFEAAASAGFAAELDVHLTADGELVVVHDYELSALTGEALAVEQLTRQMCGTLRLLGTQERVPTLAEVLACVDGRVPLMIELKRRWRASDNRRLTGAVLAQVAAYRGDYALASFDPLVVWWLCRAYPRRPVGQISGLLRGTNALVRLLGRNMPANAVTRPDFLAYELDGLPARAVSRARDRGLPVLAWTVTSPDEERRARKWADNIIFSDYLPGVSRRTP